MSQPVTLEHLAKPKRSIKNYALQPLLQVKLGLYSILLAVVFAASVGGILYMHLGKFTSIVLELTGVEDEVKDLLTQYLAPAQLQLGVLMILYILMTLIVTIKFTHKLVGPTIAFRRHIRMIASGNYDYQTKLRNGDAFNEVAEDLNKLSQILREKFADKNP